MKLKQLLQLNEAKSEFDLFYSGSSDMNTILVGFDRKYTGYDINKRNNCGPVANDLVTFLSKKGIKAKRVSGDFVVDVPDIGKLSFTKDEKNEIIAKGYDFESDADRKKYAEEKNLIDELKKIPHYWTVTETGDIIDPTTRQFKKFLTKPISKSNYHPK